MYEKIKDLFKLSPEEVRRLIALSPDKDELWDKFFEHYPLSGHD